MISNNMMLRLPRRSRAYGQTYDSPPKPHSPADSDGEPRTPASKQRQSYFPSPKTPQRARPGENLDGVSPFIYAKDASSLPLQDKRFDPNRRKLDRYVPKRDHASPVAERYRTKKESQDLSTEERLTRNKQASADPFALRRRALTPDQRFPFRSVGGLVPSAIAVDDGQGHLLQRGTNARIFPTPFQESLVNTSVEKEKHEGRVASALDLDRIRKVLDFCQSRPIPRSPIVGRVLDLEEGRTIWDGCKWSNKEQFNIPPRPAKKRLLPAAPFRVLDAPNLKDDFYCSPLAYSPTSHTLVVCLSNLLYAWSEAGVEWPMNWEVSRDTWPGAVTLMAKISNIHCQQICGLAWSSDGRLFATGGNDNLCCLFEVDHVLGQRRTESARSENGYQGRFEALSPYGGIETRVTRPFYSPQDVSGTEDASESPIAAEMRPLPNSSDTVRYLGPGAERHHWDHDAAVKAIAFCPWRRGLVATSGGSNNKCIHFYHTTSGAALATIAVSAQVTSLIWSTTRREIVATFGYAQPDHPYRISVFSWPECKQVAAIPWEGELRALYAVPYPRGPTSDSDVQRDGGFQEGSIIVASSDKSIKFHEVWSSEKGATVGGSGMLGGSDILEGLEGIDKEGDVIR
ncbi:WD40-repeat-containing domain protein [Fusarium solani]|uniref:WD40-repeat-containing domain protein n=1 Tax=Fusarium solani TaxID=169388 RepID=A0A9P9H122_FUSSL|nr:WD40-repeat-containing domain protein [Fusarium solani]KAH7249183.1 WD40-repeat-containing domain protein [Fusarium solani]